ncbi:hypothetical protein B0H10DRAFT_1940466 [Mycena sp. CBHHK59/15]|nr:hypothetical protein B0H10DRAFT_1940466 [Mycena sp. CBHHK59/15]
MLILRLLPAVPKFSSTGLELAPEDSDRFKTLSRGLSQFNTAMTLFRKRGKKAAAAEGDSGEEEAEYILGTDPGHIRRAERKKTHFWRLVPVRTKFGPSGQNLFGKKWADRVWSGSSLQRDYQGSYDHPTCSAADQQLIDSVSARVLTEFRSSVQAKIAISVVPGLKCCI